MNVGAFAVISHSPGQESATHPRRLRRAWPPLARCWPPSSPSSCSRSSAFPSPAASSPSSTSSPPRCARTWLAHHHRRDQQRHRRLLLSARDRVMYMREPRGDVPTMKSRGPGHRAGRQPGVTIYLGVCPAACSAMPCARPSRCCGSAICNAGLQTGCREGVHALALDECRPRWSPRQQRERRGIRNLKPDKHGKTKMCEVPYLFGAPAEQTWNRILP